MGQSQFTQRVVAAITLLTLLCICEVRANCNTSCTPPPPSLIKRSVVSDDDSDFDDFAPVSSAPKEIAPASENAQVSTSPPSSSHSPAVTGNNTNIKSGSHAEEEEEEEYEWDGPIRKCNHKNSEALNKCLRLILQDLKPRLAEGIPEINLPPMDPLHIDNLAFQHGSGPVNIVATFKKVEVRGLSTFNRSDFGIDQVKRTLDFDLTVPQMNIVGEYELSGNLFFFPVGGTGNFWLSLMGVSARGSGNLGIALNEKGVKTVVVKKTDLDLDIAQIKLQLTNLFMGDKILGTVINNFLNDNGKDIFEEVKPQIGIQVGEMVSILTNKALSSLSADHFSDVAESEIFAGVV